MVLHRVTTAADLAAAARSYVIAPAGCGKTELIAAAVAAEPDRRQLVLTHTHAGVAALRGRLRRYGVARSQARVETIAGFALRIATAYPATSGFDNRQPRDAAWADVYAAAGRVLGTGSGREILAASYKGAYVDEYQDCITDQHALVLAIDDVLPTRILGDPLQGIFGFRDQQIVDWTSWTNTLSAFQISARRGDGAKPTPTSASGSCTFALRFSAALGPTFAPGQSEWTRTLHHLGSWRAVG